jgi:cytochrome b561/polyisoprenoid-binding protein YceI
MTQATIRYSASAMALHWIVAALLIFNYALGERTNELRRGPELFAAFQLHKSIGIAVLLLSMWRLWIRLRRPRPEAVADLGWAKRLSSAVHAGFYIVMIGAPITGWIIVSTAKTKIPTLLFGVIPWPNLPLGGAGRAFHDLAEGTHGVLAKILIALVILHVVGAIRHQFLLKDAMLERMIPVSRAGVGALVAAAALLGGSFALGQSGPLPGLAAVSSVTTTAPATVSVGSRIKPITPLEPSSRTEQLVDDKMTKDAVKPGEIMATNVPPIIPLIAPAAAVAGPGPVPTWNVTPGGQLGFDVKVSGEAVSGRFGRWDATIAFDPDRLAQSSIKVSVDLSSVASGDSQRDGMLGGSDFFSTAAHPRATFVARDIRATGTNRYEARGTLSLKGVSRPARLVFDLTIKGNTATAKGTTQIDRTSFGVGTGQFVGDETVSHAVAISFAFTASRK